MYYTNNGKSEKSCRNGKATQRLVVSERGCHPYAGGRNRENGITETEKPAKSDMDPKQVANATSAIEHKEKEG